MNELGVFAKYWLPGQVKTRLGQTLGPAGACAAYRVFLETVLRRFDTVAQRRIVAYTPAAYRAEFAALAGPQWQLRVQAAGDLGQRLQAYFQDAFAQGAEAVVLIGSDSPTLPVHFVLAAFAALRERPVVLGPATDGGYYLIGARGWVPPAFSDVTWSSPQVWQQTVQLLERAACPFAVLPEWYDVDDLAGLQRLREELARADSPDPALAGLCHELGRILAGSESRLGVP